MTDFDVRCGRCGAAITHVCYTGLKAALKRLFEFKLDHTPEGFNKKKKDGYEKGDEDAPFFSEAYLYNLLEKDDARTVLAVLDNFIRAMGIDPSWTDWPAPTCRHIYTKDLLVDSKRGYRIEWCETCGATRKSTASKRGGGLDWKPGEWVAPTNKEDETRHQQKEKK